MKRRETALLTTISGTVGSAVFSGDKTAIRAYKKLLKELSK